MGLVRPYRLTWEDLARESGVSSRAGEGRTSSATGAALEVMQIYISSRGLGDLWETSQTPLIPHWNAKLRF